MNILAQLKGCKEIEAHLLMVGALVESGFPFIETDPMVYELKGTRFDECKFFARTCILQTRQGRHWINVKISNWNDVLDILRG